MAKKIKKITLIEIQKKVDQEINKILKIDNSKKKQKNLKFKKKPLIGNASLLKSIELVTLCVSLEDYSESFNFQFDWTSDSAMSRTTSFLKDNQTLAKEFYQQWTKSNKVNF